MSQTLFSMISPLFMMKGSTLPSLLSVSWLRALIPFFVSSLPSSPSFLWAFLPSHVFSLYSQTDTLFLPIRLWVSLSVINVATLKIMALLTWFFELILNAKVIFEEVKQEVKEDSRREVLFEETTGKERYKKREEVTQKSTEQRKEAKLFFSFFIWLFLCFCRLNLDHVVRLWVLASIRRTKYKVYERYALVSSLILLFEKEKNKEHRRRCFFLAKRR